MGRDVSDYVALALVAKLDDDHNFFGNDTRDFSGDPIQLKVRTEERCGFRVSDEILGRAIRTLSECGLIRVTDDPYSGQFIKIKASSFSQFIERAQSEIKDATEEVGNVIEIMEKPSDFPNAAAFLNHELIEDYHELGSQWLNRALLGLRERVGEGLLDVDFASDVGSFSAPAADRIVTLEHNQQVKLENAADSIIAAFEKENAVEGDLTLRAKLLGQLRAGRELIRAGIFNAELMVLTLVRALEFLAKRYEKEVIGALASALLIELMKIM